MTSAELTAAIIIFVFAGVLAFSAIRHFAEKGFLFHNVYIWASKEEREKMDKSPFYRQSAIVFSLLSAVFFVMGLAIVLQNYKIQLLEIPLVTGVLIYTIVSSVKTEKGAKK